MIKILLVFLFCSSKAFAFGDNSYSSYEAERRHGPLKSVMDAQVVKREPVTEVDRHVLMSGNPNEDETVLISRRVVSNQTAVGQEEHNSLPLDEKSVAHNPKLPTKASPAKPKRMKLVNIETTLNDWIEQ